MIPGLRQPARRSWLLPVVIAACLAAGVGIGLFLSGGGEDQRAAVPPSPEAPAAPAPARVEPPAESPQEAAPSRLRKPLLAPPAPVIEEEPAPPAAEERPAPPAAGGAGDRRHAGAGDCAEPGASASRRHPRERAARTGTSGCARRLLRLLPSPQPTPAVAGQERVYQQEMPLPGGGSLRLNGIAFSEQPVALFGDKVVGPGESVAGYKVVAIEARRVRLEGQGGVVVVVEMP